MKLKHKVLTLVLSICMIVTCLPMAALADNVPQGRWTDYAAGTFAGGTGTKDDPYQIGTAEQLALLVKDVNAGSTTHTGEYFILTDDIDLSGHVWTPLGYETYASGGGSAQSFQGYFDGNNKKITGLYVDEREGDKHGKNRNSGLFGRVGAVGTEPVIQNLIVENATVFTGDGNPNNKDDIYGAGVLIGSITVIGNNVEYASVKNCTVSGTVNSTKNAGGLVGDASYTHFENCHADVKVDGYSISGGFVGNAFKSQLNDCTASGDVTSYGWSTGGFAGVLFYNTTVKHCAAFGNVEAGDWNLGGFAGYTENAVTISNSIAMGDVKSNVTGWDPKTGGFLGTAWDSSVRLEKCHAAGKITTEITDTVGGLLGFDAGSSIIGCSFDNEKNPSFSGSTGVIAQSTAGVKASICADYYGGHDMAAKPEQKPTCTEDGHEAGSECRRCGYKEGFGVIKAPGHTGGTATCKDKAICDVCHEAYGETDPANHDANGKQEWIKTATTHEKKWSCCGAVSVASEAHEWVDGECSECKYVCLHADDNNDHKCDICGDKTSDHTGGTATCKDKAICDVCHEAYGETDPANHDANGKQEWIKTATTHEKKWSCCGAVSVASEAHEWVDGECSECKYVCLHADDNNDHKCDICGEKTSDHTGGTATCKDKAICEVCHEAYGETDANNHADLKHFDAKAATKDAEGNIEYWYCENCDKYFGDAAATKEITKADTITEKLSDGEGEKVPQTGENSNIMLWIALFVISGCALTGAAFISRKKKSF